MTPYRLVFPLLLSFPLAASCGLDQETVASQAPALDSQPAIADHGCQVVLRNASREFTGNGYATACTGDTCSWVFKGTVDIADEALVAGTTVGAVYRSSVDGSWQEVVAAREERSPPGFERFTFRIEDVFGPDTVEEQSYVELVPYLSLPDGTRLYDHNSNPGEFDNYRLEGRSFAFNDFTTCTPEVGTVFFSQSWQQYESDYFRAGGYLLLNYDLPRLPECRGTHNGAPAWDTTAYVRFSPGGELVSGTVRDFVSNMGTPTTEAFSVPFEAKIPDNATGAEVWFRNHSGAGSSCETWDSNFGNNYQFEVIPGADDPRCLGNESWSERVGRVHCLDYEVESQASANDCELYVNGLGHGYEGHYGIPLEWLESYIKVGPQDGEVLAVGMLTRYEGEGDVKERFSFGKEIEPGYWKTGFTFHKTAIMGSEGYHYGVEQMAFFVDVRRPSGEITRLWQSKGGSNYSWDDAFSKPTIGHPIPYGNVQYASDGSAVFDSRWSCQ